MGYAIGLSISLGIWYFECVLAPFSLGMLTLLPAAGVVALVDGTILGVQARDRSLLLFGAAALLSHAYVAIAGLFHGSFDDSNNPVFFVFLIFQVLLAAYLVYRAKNARPAAMFLAMFTTSYSHFASFVAAMSFSNTWL